MKFKLSKHHLVFVAAILLLVAQVAGAQEETKPQRLRSPATVRSVIGGESQDHYVIHARKGRTMTVRISWKKEDNNTASFSIARASAPDGEPLPGEESEDGNRWTGRIQRTGDYLISVVAHPSANYTLRVTVK